MTESALFQKFNNDLQDAKRDRDAEILRVLRFSKASLDSAEKEKGAPLSDEEVIKVIGKKIKQSQDSIAQFKAGNRPDLVAAEEQDVAILSHYMPQQLRAEELAKIVDDVIAETNAKSPRDIGRVMALVMKKISGKADGTAVKLLVEEKLKNK